MCSLTRDRPFVRAPLDGAPCVQEAKEHLSGLARVQGGAELQVRSFLLPLPPVDAVTMVLHSAVHPP